MIINLHLYIEFTMPKVKRVKSTAKSIICNVHDYFDWQSNKQKSTPPKLSKKTAEATGFSECTVNCVILEKRKLDGSSFISPNKRYTESREHVDVDAFVTDSIHRTVYEFYDKKEYPTLDKLLQVLKVKMLFKGGRIALWKLFRKITFRYKKVNDKRYVYEQPHIIQQRHQFLRRMRRNRRERRPVVYTNETWANSHDDILQVERKETYASQHVKVTD